MDPFSVIVLGVVVCGTIGVSGAKQLRFRLKTGLVWTGPKALLLFGGSADNWLELRI